MCWCLQGGRCGGFPHSPIRPHSSWKDALLDRLADPIHPRLQQIYWRETERNSQRHLFADGHPGAGPRAAAQQWVYSPQELTTLDDRWLGFYHFVPWPMRFKCWPWDSDWFEVPIHIKFSQTMFVKKQSSSMLGSGQFPSRDSSHSIFIFLGHSFSTYCTVSL